MTVSDQYQSCVVIEEAHEVIMSEAYRPSMNVLAKHRQLGCPTYLCSASLPPYMEHLLLDRVGVSQPWIIRLPTSRPELLYSVWPDIVDERVGKAVLQSILTKWISSQLFGNSGKIFVFCQTIREVDELHALFTQLGLPCAKCHSIMPDQEASASINDFVTSSTTSIMFATTGLGAGIDLELVCAVVFYGLPPSIIQLDQGFGRGGRGRYNSISLAIRKVNNAWGKNKHDAVDVTRFEEVQAWANNSTQCRRWWITKELYGQGFTCVMLGSDAAWCDNCSLCIGLGHPTTIPVDTHSPWTPLRWSTRDTNGIPSILIKAGSAAVAPSASTSITSNDPPVPIPNPSISTIPKSKAAYDDKDVFGHGTIDGTSLDPVNSPSILASPPSADWLDFAFSSPQRPAGREEQALSLPWAIVLPTGPDAITTSTHRKEMTTPKASWATQTSRSRSNVDVTPLVEVRGQVPVVESLPEEARRNIEARERRRSAIMREFYGQYFIIH